MRGKGCDSGDRQYSGTAHFQSQTNQVKSRNWILKKQPSPSTGTQKSQSRSKSKSQNIQQLLSLIQAHTTTFLDTGAPDPFSTRGML